MDPSQASRTALRVALRRAAHQVLDTPRVFTDPLAAAIIGDEARRLDHPASHTGLDRAARAFMAVRSRIAEDALDVAVQNGVRQYVVLGAGLDTFAYRNAHETAGLRVFEVDYPSTQHWKRERLAHAGIPIPASVVFAPVDFEHETLAAGLAAVGFDVRSPAFFSWLGVTMYLTVEAVASTLRYIGHLPERGGVVFDYGVPPSTLSLTERLVLEGLSARVAAAGEPFTSFFEPADLARRVGAAGLDVVDDLGRDEINARYFSDRADGLALRGRLGRILIARVRSAAD
jgi:methyltransferase (TIGR00027 family)